MPWRMPHRQRRWPSRKWRRRRASRGGHVPPQGRDDSDVCVGRVPVDCAILDAAVGPVEEVEVRKVRVGLDMKAVGGAGSIFCGSGTGSELEEVGGRSASCRAALNAADGCWHGRLSWLRRGGGVAKSQPRSATTVARAAATAALKLAAEGARSRATRHLLDRKPRCEFAAKGAVASQGPGGHVHRGPTGKVSGLWTRRTACETVLPGLSCPWRTTNEPD